jgi:hypothetical protein
MKKVLGILALALFLGGFTATAIAATLDAPSVEILAEEEKKSEKKTSETEAKKETSKATKKGDCSSDCSKKCDGEKKKDAETKKTTS